MFQKFYRAHIKTNKLVATFVRYFGSRIPRELKKGVLRDYLLRNVFCGLSCPENRNGGNIFRIFYHLFGTVNVTNFLIVYIVIMLGESKSELGENSEIIAKGSRIGVKEMRA